MKVREVESSGNLSHLVLLQEAWLACLFSRTSSPPLLSGMMWSTTYDMGSGQRSDQSIGNSQIPHGGLVRRMAARSRSRAAVLRGALLIPHPPQQSPDQSQG